MPNKALRLTPLETGPLPSDWLVRRIGDVSDKVRNGFVGKSVEHQVNVGGVLYLQGFNIRPGKVDIARTTSVSNEFHSSQPKSQLKPGDVLVVQSGHIGTCARVPDNFPEANCHALIIVDPDRSLVDPDFLVNYLNSDIGQRRMQGLFVGSSMPHINTSELADYYIPVPSFHEQRKIADIFGTWDQAIEACDQLIAAKQMRLAAARQRLFNATRPGAEPDVVASWNETTLGAIFTEISESNPGLGPDTVITVGKYAIRRQVEHFTRSVASANLSNYQLLAPGDFVYDPMSAYYGAIGRYSGSDPGIVSPAYTVIRLSDGINPIFVEGLLKSHYIAFELESRSSQGNREGKRRTLRSDEFSSVHFMLPPRKVQERIADILSEIVRDLELTTRSRDALMKQKRGLMQKLLTGEWRVKPGGSDG